MDMYEQEAKDNADNLAREIKAVKPNNKIEVIKGDNGRTDYQIILTEAGRDYEIRKDYTGNVYVNQTQGSRTKAPNVSSQTQGELRKQDTTQKMKVITAKKLDAKIEAERVYNEQLAVLEAEAKQKNAEFMDTIKDLPIIYSHNYEQTEITGGYLTKNGLEFSFEIGQDGYISKKIRLATYDNSLETFEALADNKFIARKE